MKTTIESDNVFKSNTTYPKIKAKEGSKAAKFARANGYTFINMETGEETKGTKPAPGEASITPAVPDEGEFDHEGATLWGHSTEMYEGSQIINTWWAYYDETKTLEFVSATNDYNETGTLNEVDEEYEGWYEYTDVIEHIIIGDRIHKISSGAFQNFTALKDVRLGRSVNQISAGAF